MWPGCQLRWQGVLVQVLVLACVCIERLGAVCQSEEVEVQVWLWLWEVEVWVW